MATSFGDTADYIVRHDLIYHTPPVEGWEAFPLGNGSLGGPLWTQSNGIVFQVNHTDSYELPDPDCADEPWAILRSCGRLTMEYAVPFQDWLYLKDFQGRLSLSDATAEFRSQSAFGEFQTTAFVHAEHPVTVFDCRAAYSAMVGGGGAPVRINLERWGSRVCGWWYTRLSGNADAGVGKCVAYVDGQDIGLELDFRGVSVALRCRVVGANSTSRVVHGHRAEIEIEAASVQNFKVLLSCVTSHSSSDPKREAREAIDRVMAESDSAAVHRAWWREYWNRSFLTIGNDYYENLYYLHLYLMGASARGIYPPLFNGGLWIWNHDVRNWVNPHHWNEQQPHWCLYTANRLDLLEPYLKTYSAIKDEGIEMSRRKGRSGMLWSEMHDFFGRQLSENSPSMMDNFTPASQMALFFWWHYRFSGDLEALRMRGYPFLRAAADFYVDWVVWDKKELRYELPLASTYEDERHDQAGRPMRFTNSITNLGMVKSVLSALIAASEALDIDSTMKPQWQHILDHLPPFVTNGHDTERGVTLGSGLLYGEDTPLKEDHNHGPLFCPIVPAGVIGLKDEGTSVFEAACNTIRTYPHGANAITPTVIVAARLGLSDECLKRLDSMVRNLQQFATGMFFNLDHWFIYSRQARISLSEWKDEDVSDLQRDYIVDTASRYPQVTVSAYGDKPERSVDIPTRPFAQPGLESLGHFAAGIQEMLLQSHEGSIRVFPAVPDEWDGAFMLLAEGGFLVASQRESLKEPSFVSIVSQHGGVCSLISPWKSGAKVWRDGIPQVEHHGDVFSIETDPGQRYMLTSSTASSLPEPTIERSSPNVAPKKYHQAILGKPRDF